MTAYGVLYHILMALSVVFCIILATRVNLDPSMRLLTGAIGLYIVAQYIRQGAMEA
jgi:uncharacterized membrane protein YgaE (UPF0421/DUF939 family)